MNTKTIIANNLLNTMEDSEVIQALTKFSTVAEAEKWAAQLSGGCKREL